MPLKDRAKSAHSYAVEHGLNTRFCILVDMSIHSGRYRLFVWDFEGDSILLQGLCAHGSCDGPGAPKAAGDGPVFSNVPETHCSSLGKYRVGARSWSNWGINVHYKLHGLEATNNNAYARQIVLHSWEWVGDEESFPNGCPDSWGCPMVSNEVMRQLDTRLKAVDKPVLLWIYQ